MAVATRLPNGYVVLLLTPREATCVRDELLEPGDFPWQSSENQMVAHEVRHVLTQTISEDAVNRLNIASAELVHMMEERRREDGEGIPE